MKEKFRNWAMLLCFLFCLILFLGVGYESSSSAVLDLKEELQLLHGEEYTGRHIENGTQDMVFVIKPKTFFLTNWNIRHAFGLDYEYECTVTITDYDHTGIPVNVNVSTYQGIDPMGADAILDRAHLNLASKSETYPLAK